MGATHLPVIRREWAVGGGPLSRPTRVAARLTTGLSESTDAMRHRGGAVKAFNHTQAMIKSVIALLGVALTGLLIYMALSLVPTRYEATATVLLIPGETSIPAEGNPFLHLGGVSQARDVLVKIADSDAVRADLRSDDVHDANFKVLTDITTGAPLILVTSEGTRSATVLALRDAVLDVLPRELNRVQDAADTPSGSRITSMLLVSDEKPERNSKSQIRAAVVAGLVGVGVTLGALAATDALGRRRRTGYRPGSGDFASPDGGPEPERSSERLEANKAPSATLGSEQTSRDSPMPVPESLERPTENGTLSDHRLVSGAAPTRR